MKHRKGPYRPRQAPRTIHTTAYVYHVGDKVVFTAARRTAKGRYRAFERIR